MTRLLVTLGIALAFVLSYIGLAHAQTTAQTGQSGASQTAPPAQAKQEEDKKPSPLEVKAVRKTPARSHTPSTAHRKSQTTSSRDKDECTNPGKEHCNADFTKDANGATLPSNEDQPEQRVVDKGPQIQTQPAPKVEPKVEQVRTSQGAQKAREDDTVTLSYSGGSTVTMSDNQQWTIDQNYIVKKQTSNGSVKGPIYVWHLQGHNSSAELAGCTTCGKLDYSRELTQEELKALNNGQDLVIVKDGHQFSDLERLSNVLIDKFAGKTVTSTSTSVMTALQKKDYDKLLLDKEDCHIKDVSFNSEKKKIEVLRYKPVELAEQIGCYEHALSSLHDLSSDDSKDKDSSKAKARVSKILSAINSKYIAFRQTPRASREEDITDAFNSLFSSAQTEFDESGSDAHIRLSLMQTETQGARQEFDTNFRNISQLRDQFELMRSSGNRIGAENVARLLDQQYKDYSESYQEARNDALKLMNDSAYRSSVASGSVGPDMDIMNFATDPRPLTSYQQLRQRIHGELSMPFPTNNNTYGRNGGVYGNGSGGSGSSYDLMSDLNSRNAVLGGDDTVGRRLGGNPTTGRRIPGMPSTLEDFYRGSNVTTRGWSGQVPSTPPLSPFGNTAVGNNGFANNGQMNNSGNNNNPNIWNGRGGNGSYAFPPPAQAGNNGVMNFQNRAPYTGGVNNQINPNLNRSGRGSMYM